LDRLTPDDTNLDRDVFVRDTFLQTTVCLSVSSSGFTPTGYYAEKPYISADGRYVVFKTNYAHSVADTNNGVDAYVRDLQTGILELAIVGTNGLAASVGSDCVSLSADGRYAAVVARGTNLGPGGSSTIFLAYVRDRLLGTNEMVSLDTGGNPADQGCIAAIVSRDGQYALFSTKSTMGTSDSNTRYDIFRRNRAAGVTEIVSRKPAGPSIDFDTAGGQFVGSSRFIYFSSKASNIVSGDTNGVDDVFCRDMQLGTMTRLSVGPANQQGTNDSTYYNVTPSGTLLTFASLSANFVSGDTNSMEDVFLKQLTRYQVAWSAILQ